MKNHKKILAAFIAGFFTGAMMAILTSCQSNEPLKGLNCPCDVISAELTYNGHIVTYIDKDGKQSTVISEALYEQYKKNLKK